MHGEPIPDSQKKLHEHCAMLHLSEEFRANGRRAYVAKLVRFHRYSAGAGALQISAK